VSVCPCIKDDARHIAKSYLMELVNDSPLMVALVVAKINMAILLAKAAQEWLESLVAINARFAFAEQVQIWPIDYYDVH
jgi:hypothetical protein